MVFPTAVIERSKCFEQIKRALARNPVVSLVGPRQCGKTTLARQFVPSESVGYFDLEDPSGLARLEEPVTALKDLKGLVVIDEIQRQPGLFPVLRVLADRVPQPATFLVLGSASPDLIKGASESLAGRLETVHLGGFGLNEVGFDHHARHWVRGGFPRSFLPMNDEDSFAWRKEFLTTFLERDIPRAGVSLPAQAMLRLWTMLAHYHGQVFNAAELARSLGISQHSVRHYVDMLSGFYLVRQLQPWHENLAKRQVRAPKVYFRDSGLLHYLLGAGSELALLSNPKCGASWEGYVIEEVIKAFEPDEAFFWATHGGAELDLLLLKGGRRYGVEVKRTDAPRLTKSLSIAVEDLKLDRAAIVFPGDKRFRIADVVEAVPISALASGSPGLFGEN